MARKFKSIQMVVVDKGLGFSREFIATCTDGTAWHKRCMKGNEWTQIEPISSSEAQTGKAQTAPHKSKECANCRKQMITLHAIERDDDPVLGLTVTYAGYCVSCGHAYRETVNTPPYDKEEDDDA